MRHQCLGVLFFALLTGSVAWADSPSITGTGHLTGGNNYVAVSAISRDGMYVTGESVDASGGQAFLWSRQNGMNPLGDLAGGTFYSYGYSVADGGVIVVGRGTYGDSLHYHAFRWSGGTMADLGDLNLGTNQSEAYGISCDGSVIVGFTDLSGWGRRAFRWTSSGGMVALPSLPGVTSAYANAVSADGSTVVGNYSDSHGWGASFMWRQDTGTVNLGSLPGGTTSSATAVNKDGSVIVGSAYHRIKTPSYDDIFQEAYIWTQSGGMVGLGTLAGDNPKNVFLSSAAGVSADGTVVVGMSGTPSGGQVPFLWTAQCGMRPLVDVLTQDYGLDLTGWQLQYVSGISDDGMTMAGGGRNPAGQLDGWVVHVPEPATLSLLALGGLAMFRRTGR